MQLVTVHLHAETMRGSDLVCGCGESLEGREEGEEGFAAHCGMDLLITGASTDGGKVQLPSKHHHDAPYNLDSSSYRTSRYQYHL